MVLPQDLLLEVVLVDLPVTGRRNQKAEDCNDRAFLYFCYVPLNMKENDISNNMITADQSDPYF